MAARGTGDSLKRGSARGGNARGKAARASGDTGGGGGGGTSAPVLEFGGILAIADALPVMVAYIDTGQIYRFINKPVSDWFERPRSAILGRTMREVMGDNSYACARRRSPARSRASGSGFRRRSSIRRAGR